jgi:RNA polymerase-interacting CarD/CdnL/TRCF family regulator
VAVSINLEEIVERAVPTSQGLYRVVRTEDFDALISELRELRSMRRADNEDIARAYDFARDKGQALERAAVVAYLRACDGESYDFADDIERGEHRREEKP